MYVYNNFASVSLLHCLSAGMCVKVDPKKMLVLSWFSSPLHKLETETEAKVICLVGRSSLDGLRDRIHVIERVARILLPCLLLLILGQVGNF